MPQSRFRFSGRAQPVTLDEGDAAVCGYAWVQPSPVATLLLLQERVASDRVRDIVAGRVAS